MGDGGKSLEKFFGDCLHFLLTCEAIGHRFDPISSGFPPGEVDMTRLGLLSETEGRGVRVNVRSVIITANSGFLSD